MKIRIMDLMDYYQGDAKVPLVPYEKWALQRGAAPNAPKQTGYMRKPDRVKQRMMIAASLVLVVSFGAFALWKSPLLQSAWGNAAAESGTPMPEVFGNPTMTAADSSAWESTTEPPEATPEPTQETISEQAKNYPVLEQEEGSWLCKVYDPASEDDIHVWYMYRVSISSFERWSRADYPEWESAPILSELYQIGKDDTYVYLMDAPTSVSELYGDAEKKALFYQAQLDGKQYIYDIIEESGMQANPNWETMYDQCFLIDRSVDVETAYTTITDPEKGLAYVVPADRQDCYVFSEKEDTCVIRIASYVASYLSLDDVAQWTIKRVPVNELELAQADDATFCCTLGCDARYAYYLSLSTGLRWLENDAYSESRFRAEMQEGSLVIERFLEQNAITPENDWMQLLAAEAQLSSAPTDAIIILDSSYAKGTLYIPAGESDEFKADTAFSYSYYIGGNSSDDLQDVTYKEENAIFSFFDTCQMTYDRDGLVWLVYKYSIDELDSLVESDSEWGNNSFLLNWHILGYDSDTVYMLFCVGMGFGDPLADQLEWDALESVQSYCDHLETGLVVLENFVEKNGLTVPEGCVDWKSWYQENMLDKAKKQIETLTTAQAGSSNKN